MLQKEIKSTAGAGLDYEVAGLSNGPAVLLIHGALSSNLQWYLNRESLGESCRLVMVELPGHGGSYDPPEPDVGFTIESIAAQLEGIRRELAVESWHCIGHSLGAAVALSYGLLCPEAIRSCVITNSQSILGFATNNSGEAGEQLRAIGLRGLPFHPINARSLDGDIKEKFVGAADRVDIETLIAFGSAANRYPCRSELADWGAPLLLVNGTREAAFQPHVAKLGALVPDMEVLSLDCGHSPNMERAALFNERVLEFLGRF